MAIDVEKLIRDVRTANGAQTSARADSGHVAVVQGKGSSNGAQVSAKDDDDPWYLKAAKWIDAHKTDDADVTFNYGALTNGNRTLTETAERARAKSDTLRQANSAAAEALRQSQKPESSGTTFGKDHVDANKEGMSWWERLTANAANAADEAFGTYSPGNATSRSKVGNTVAGGLQETGGSMFEALGFVTDQKGDKTPTEADMAFGSGTLTDTLPFMKKFWQSISDKSYKQSDKLFKEAEESTIVAKDGSGTVGSFVVDAGKATTQLGADIVTAAVSGGSALVPMAIRSFGGGLREARDEGWSKQEQFNYAVGSAAIETMTEKLSSVALPFKAAYGKGAVDDIIERLISGSAKTEVGRASLRALFSAIGEGNEEMISDVLNPILKTLVRYDTSELDSFATPEFWSQTLRDGLLGASIGVFGSGGRVVGAAVNSRKGAQTAAGQDGTSFTVPVENGAQSATAPTDVPTMQQASDIVADVALGKVGADTQLNIDNTARPVYTGNSNINGGAQNVSGRSLEADSDGISGVYDSGDTGHQGRSRLGGNSVGSGFVLSAQAQNAIRSRGVDIVETKDVSANSAAFSAALDESRAANAQNGWAVTPKSAQEIAENGVRVYMNDSESTGYGIAPDGDIEAVFANKSKGAPRHALASVMPQAIANGGTKLDCYGLGLVRLYSRYGFVPVARVQFNAEYANEGWAPDKGAPDIYFMMATDLDPDSVAQNFGNYPVLTQAQLDALPVMDYDEAYAYRDSLLAQQEPNLPKGTGAAELGFTGKETPVDAWVAEAQGIGDRAIHDVSAEAAANLARQQHRAPQDVPKYDKDGRLTRAGVEAVINSGFTDNAFAQRMLEETFEGAVSYSQFSDKRALRKAKTDIKKQGYAEATAKYLLDSFNGKVSKQSTVTGLVLLDNAIAAKDYELAVKLTVALAEDGTNSAQALQARRLLNKMTPSGKLYAVTQVADRAAAAQRELIGEARIDREADKIENATEEVKQTVAENFKTRAQRQSNKTVEGNQAGEPFWFEYETEVGKAIADAVKNRVALKSKKQQPFMRTVIRNLTAFANQLTPKAVVNPKMTATERIADYLANKEFYDNAWANAQEELVQRYENDEAMLDALDEFTSSLTTMSTPTGTQTMIKALAESAFDQYLDAKTLAIQNALNIDGAANAIAQRLVSEIERIGGIEVDEETALSIRLAADDYVQGVIAEVDPNALVSAQIKDVLRNLDVKLAEVATSSRVDKTAVGMAVIDMLTKRWGFSEADALNVAEVVQSQFVDMVTETMERKLKQIYGEKKEREVKSMTQLFVESVNLGAFDSGEYAQKAAERFFGADIQIDPDLAREYVEALEDGTDEDIADALKALEQNIADQMPANWKDKLNAWRYLAMLGNFRTHGRNISGNVFFMPVRMTKNLIGAGIEAAVDAASKDGIERTKSVLNPLSATDRGLFALAWADYPSVKAEIMAGGKYDDRFNSIRNMRTVLDFKPLEYARKKNGELLDLEDSWFSQPAYAESLASWLKANGYDATGFSNGAMSEETLAKARSYAIKEAEKATYRDVTAFSAWVSSLRVRTSNKTFNTVANTVIEGVLPFKKTPANILVRALEYSPLELFKTLTVDSVKLRNGSITAAEYIDNLAQGLTGTALVGLGVLLASLNLLSGGDDPDDKQADFDKLRGKQAYAINGDGWTATLDWLAPESMPLFVGVELYKKLTDDNEAAPSLSEVLNVLSNITAPMLEMSMLQGVNEAIEGLDFRDGSALSNVAVKALGSLVSQFFPTIFGQIERAMTQTRQTTFADKNGSMTGNAQRYIGNLANKIPGVDFQQIDYIDAWGRTADTGSVGARIFNNLINPANVRYSGTTDVDDELQRLYDSGETGVFPQRPAQSTQIGGKYLSAEEYVEYSKKRGSESLAVVRKLINSTAYKSMSDADKAAAIKEAYNYANGIAKQTVRRGTEVSSWIEKAKASGNPAQYITDRSIMKTEDTDGNGNFSNAEKVRGLIAGGYSGAQLTEKVREYMTSDSGNCALGDYLERAQAANVPDSIALDVYEFNSGAHADKDENGKSISGSKKAKVVEYINSQQLTAAQKRALYYSLYKK